MGNFKEILASVLILLGMCWPVQANEFPMETFEKSIVRVINISARGISIGTGFAVSDDGYIMTNNHVVAGQKKLLIQPSNSRQRYEGKLIWSHPDQDLAVIKVEGLKLPPLRLSENSAKKGQDVYAIGYPAISDKLANEFAIDAVLTDGLISRIYQGSWSNRKYGLEMLQHTAAINPGNSGGPLMTICGVVIGVNTAGATKTIKSTFLASSSIESINVLKSLGIDPLVSDSRCMLVDMGTSTVIWITAASIAFLTFAYMLYLKFSSPARVAAPTARGRASPRQISGTAVPIQSTRKISAVQPAALGRNDPPHGISLTGFSESGYPINLQFSAQDLLRNNGVIIGRDQRVSNGVIAERSISKKHFQISWTGNQLEITDLSSTNGTSVNGVMLNPYDARPIRLNDEIMVCGIQLRLSSL